jgi:hypothetical protein
MKGSSTTSFYTEIIRAKGTKDHCCVNVEFFDEQEPKEDLEIMISKRILWHSTESFGRIQNCVLCHGSSHGIIEEGGSCTLETTIFYAHH